MAKFVASVKSSTPGSASADWKAAGYLNMYLPSVSGKEKKFGAIALRASKPAEKELSDWIEANADYIHYISKNIVVEFNSPNASNQDQFDLGFEVKPATSEGEKTGWLNFFLPSKDGSRSKLGAIPIKESDPERGQMLAWFEEDVKNVAKFASKLIIKYHNATSSKLGFALV